MDRTVPPPQWSRRVLHSAAAALAVTAVLAVLALPVDLVLGHLSADQLLWGLGAYLVSMGPVALLAGLLAAAVSGAGRWMWSTSPQGTAAQSAGAAAALGLMVTFGMLWAPLAMVLQLLWIAGLAAACGWVSWRLDARASA